MKQGVRQLLPIVVSVVVAACHRGPRDAPAGGSPGVSTGTRVSAVTSSPSGATPSVVATAAPLATPATEPEAPHVEEFLEEDAFVVRGSKSSAKGVLFGGQCAQPQGYVDAIKIAAARRMQLVALRGDKPCSGEFRGWKFDLEKLSKRIDRTFAALGLGEARDVLLIGYSQGASVAELLAAREPEKFTRVVLIAKPSKPDPWHFEKAKAVATMAGTLDAQDKMIKGSRGLAAAGIRSKYFPLPGAAHGYMGDDPEGTFEKVFAWIYDAPAP